MSKRLTHEEFLEKLKDIGNTDFKILNKYTSNRGYIYIKNKYGICKVLASNLMAGRKPTIQSSTDKTSYWINKAKEVHNNLYTYKRDNEYVTKNSKMNIVCKVHGEFSLLAHNHLSGGGCPKCNSKTFTYSKNFIKRANKVHNNSYEYVKTNTLKSHSKIKIICKKHGNFKQTAHNHLNGIGCPKCSFENKMDNYTENFKIRFLKESDEIHNGKYLYIEDSIINCNYPTTIICPKHGRFEQLASSHIKGHGCNQCGNEIGGEYHRENPTGWKYNNWVKAGKKSKNFDSFKIYIVKCWNDEEEFYKIGRTFTTVVKRLTSKSLLPYNFEEIKTIISEDARCICELEWELKQINKKFKYTPKIKFGGYRECFSKVELDFINKCE